MSSAGAQDLHGDRRRTLLVCLLLALAGAAFRLPRLGTPAELVYDEGFFVPSAVQYLEGRPPVEMTHPPLAKLLIAASIALFGPGPAAWRLPSALAGALLAPALFLLGRVVLRRERAALLSATLLLLDGQALVQSRLAMTSAIAVLLQVLAACLLVSAALRDELRAGRFLGAALCAGLALATRWSTLPVLAFLALVLLCVRRGRLLRRRELLLACAAGGVIAAVYLASFVPWMAQGHSLADVLQLQRNVLQHHSALGAAHPYASRWYTWPWLLRPSLYYFQPAQPAHPWVAVVTAIGNPAIWWLAVPAALAALIVGWRCRDARPLFCAAGFAFTYLWWALSNRPLQFAHYFLEAVPFACLCLGFLLDRAWDGRWRWLCWTYVVVTALLFLHFYPVQTALPLPADWFYRRLFGDVYPWRWLPTWY
jgi:dolichyl-phosphate-mannose-protein mannosyltransferase